MLLIFLSFGFLIPWQSTATPSEGLKNLIYSQHVAYATASPITPISVSRVKTHQSSPKPLKQSTNQLLASSDIPESDWVHVDYIVTRESGWNPSARNPSGACGLMQFLPCTATKAGKQWNDPQTALAKGHTYALATYGSWEAAHAFWIKNHYW